MNYCSATLQSKTHSGATFENLTLVMLGIYFYLEIVCPHSMYSQAMMVVAVLCCFFCLLGKKNNEVVFYFKINPLIVCYGSFIVDQCLLYAFNQVKNPTATLADIRTMIISIIFLVFAYSFLYKKVTLLSFEKMFVAAGIVSVLTVLFLCRDSIGTGRLAHTYQEGVSYYFLGTAVALSSNSLASLWSLSVYFLLYFFNQNRYKLQKLLLLLSILILIFGILLTGSRKGFLILVLCVCGYFFLSGKANVLLKILFIILLAVALYFIVLNVPLFYTTIGERLEILVNNFLGISDSVEGSMFARDRYAALALEAISNNPIFGYGSGWFDSLYGNVTENDYYETLVAGGAIGFIIKYFFVLSALFVFLKYKSSRRAALKYFLLFIIILIIMWGTVIVLSRNYLIYLSIYFLSFDKLKNEKD